MDLGGDGVEAEIVALLPGGGATARTGLTAWVCTTDDIALPALRYARHRHIDVPRTLSTVGFDDTPLAGIAGLASCSFRIRRTVGRSSASCWPRTVRPNSGTGPHDKIAGNLVIQHAISKGSFGIKAG
ncbi:MAG: hypothetical protein GF331_18855 [Chitinivibrionales bacterium]|nr:hypothetical protein [Chitinivibrionales bacterium]